MPRSPPDEPLRDADATLRDLTATRGDASSSTRTGLTIGPSLSPTLLGPRRSLHLEELARIRRFVGSTLPFGVVVALALPFTEHDPYTLGAMLSGFCVYIPVALQLLLALRDAEELPVLPVVVFGLGSLYAATAGIYYFGLFSPAAMGVAFGLFFFSPSTSFGAAFAIYASGALMHAALAAAVLGGFIADRGVVRAGELGISEQIAIQLLVQVVYLASFVIGRATRSATLAAIGAHDAALQQLERREELLEEARQELEAALGAGKPGHYSGQELGGFVLGQVVGRGAMGEIYEGVSRENGSRAAVKLLHRHALGQPDQLRSFMREAKTAAGIDSPHVCRVIDVGGLDAPLPYLAMELLRGRDLAELLRERPRLSLREVVRLVREIGRALDAAHALGIVHRDVNPRNVFLHEAAEGSSFKLLDFGVATASEAGPGDAVAGTPQYMAPELAEGRAVDHRADLFSLAATAYRALTGHAPFSGQGIADTLLAVTRGMPARPSELVRVPEAMDAVLAVALAKHPEQRFGSAAELSAAFERAARGEADPELGARAARLLEKLPWGSKLT